MTIPRPPLQTTDEDFRKLLHNPHLDLGHGRLSAEELSLKSRVLSDLRNEPLQFVDRWLSVATDDALELARGKLDHLLHCLESPTNSGESQFQDIRRGFARLCLERIARYLREDEVSCQALLTSAPTLLPSLWNKVKLWAETYDQWVSSSFDTDGLQPNPQVGTDPLQYSNVNDMLTRQQFLAKQINPHPTETHIQVARCLLAIAEWVEQERLGCTNEVICLLASGQSNTQHHTGGVAIVRVTVIFTGSAEQRREREVRLTPWSRYEMGPSSNSPLSNLQEAVLPKLKQILGDPLAGKKTNTNHYTFMITFLPAKYHAPTSYKLEGKSLGLPLAVAIYAGIEKLTLPRYIAAVGEVDSENGQVTASDASLYEKFEWLRSYNIDMTDAPVKWLYLPTHAKDKARQISDIPYLTVNQSMRGTESFSLQGLEDILRKEIFVDPRVKYLDTLYKEMEGIFSGMAIKGHESDQDKWEKIAHTARPGKIHVICAKDKSQLDLIRKHLLFHFAKLYRESQAVLLPVWLDIHDIHDSGTQGWLVGIERGLRKVPEIQLANLNQIDIQNTWNSTDGFVLLLYEESLSNPMPLFKLLEREDIGLERHRLICIAKDLHQMIGWAQSIETNSEMPRSRTAKVGTNKSTEPKWWRAALLGKPQ